VKDYPLMLIKFRLPLSYTEPEVFKNYPEYMLDDIVKNFNFIFRYAEDSVTIFR